MSEADQKKFGLEIAQNGIAGILTLTEGAVKFFGYSTKIIATKNVIANSVFSIFDVFDADTAEEKIVQLSGAFGSVVGARLVQRQVLPSLFLYLLQLFRQLLAQEVLARPLVKKLLSVP